MSRVPQVIVDPQDPRSVVEHLYRVQRVVDGRLEFGSPQDPRDPASTTLASGAAAAHNGTLLNVLGSWVEVDVVALDTLVLCTHNLAIPVTSVGGVNQPNVRWLLFGFQHSGNTADAASVLSCNYELGDAASITQDAFPLRFYAAGARTVGADPDDIRASLFFVPAVR